MLKKLIILAAAAALMLSCSSKIDGPDPNFHIYLCIGQSNMEGYPGTIETIDTMDVDSRFQVWQTVDCPDNGWVKGQWRTAVPPLTKCWCGLTPADYFGRTLVDCLPKKIRVGVVVVAVGGCKIQCFDKDSCMSYVATSADWLQNNVNTNYGGNCWEFLINAAKEAQKSGVIKGILLHQGESNCADPAWPLQVKKVYEDLLAELGLEAENVPLLAGEVVNKSQEGVCASHNEVLATLPDVIPTAYVISSKDCPERVDHLHFASAGYRELGHRYGAQMLSILTDKKK